MTALDISDLTALRAYIEQILCEHNELEIGIFEITERILARGGRPCGVLYCLHGPRSVKLTAIWETERNCVLFYGSTGERQHKVQLVHAPCLEAA